MGAISISTEQVLVVIGAASTITTAIFWGAYMLGKLVGRVDRVEERVDGHDKVIERLEAAR